MHTFKSSSRLSDRAFAFVSKMEKTEYRVLIKRCFLMEKDATTISALVKEMLPHIFAF